MMIKKSLVKIKEHPYGLLNSMARATSIPGPANTPSKENLPHKFLWMLPMPKPFLVLLLPMASEMAVY